MQCPCGQPARPRVGVSGPAPMRCAACHKARKAANSARWREKNREIHNQNGRDWRERNPEHAREARRARWWRNHERNLEAKRAWWWKNRERLVEAKRAARRQASASGAGATP
jgi:hypothetical protein